MICSQLTTVNAHFAIISSSNAPLLRHNTAYTCVMRERGCALAHLVKAEQDDDGFQAGKIALSF